MGEGEFCFFHITELQMPIHYIKIISHHLKAIYLTNMAKKCNLVAINIVLTKSSLK